MCTTAPSGFSHVEKLISSRTKGAKHEYRKSVYLITNMTTGTLKQTDLSKLPTRKGFFKETMKMKYLALHALPDISEAEEKTWRSVSLIDITNDKAQKV